MAMLRHELSYRLQSYSWLPSFFFAAIFYFFFAACAALSPRQVFHYAIE
jgi:hypothetical protein